MNAGCRKPPQSAEIDAVQRLAAEALDFEPRKAAVDRLIDRGRRVHWFAVAPHPLIPALAGEIIRFLNKRLTLAAQLISLSRQNAGHSPRLSELLL